MKRRRKKWRPGVANEAELRDEMDAYIFLGNVKQHLADHQPVTEGDANAWEIVDIAQARAWEEEVRRG